MSTAFHGIAVRKVHVDVFCSDDQTLREIIEAVEERAPSWGSILVGWAPDGKQRDLDSHQSVTISRITGGSCSDGRPPGSALKATAKT